MTNSKLLSFDTLELSNGLRVVLSEDHAVPVVAVNLWYHVGSANEPPGRTGFAHLFEHMLFQGSAHVAANEHFELVQRAGGTLNGSTWLDRTNYYETMPANQLALALWLEADRMGALLPAMTQLKLDTQRDVVKNERRWTIDNQPYGTWWERLPALCFPPEHPFHHSLMGSMDDLTAASLDDVSTFFRTYYTPDNAVLTIAGDFERHHAEDLVHHFFGAIAQGADRPPLAPVALPPLFGEWRRQEVEDDIVVPRLFLAFRIPPLGTPEHFVARVCAAIFGLQRGSMLHRRLVRERQVASTATAFTFDLVKGSDLFVLDVTARPGVSASTIESEVAAVVDDMIAHDQSDAELTRAKALLETEFVASMQTAGERADRLSQYMTYFADPGRVNRYLPSIEAVTATDLRQFAITRLAPNNRASLLYVPRSSGAA